MIEIDHPEAVRGWFEWERDGEGPSQSTNPVLVIETTTALTPGPDRIDSSSQEDMIDAGQDAVASACPNLGVRKVRAVPVGSAASQSRHRLG